MEEGQKCPLCKKGRLYQDAVCGVMSTDEDGPSEVEEYLLFCDNEDCEFKEYLGREIYGHV